MASKEIAVQVVYFGFNDPLRYKRGVENVIKIQAAAGNFQRRYYVFFDRQVSVKRWDNVICISLRKNLTRFLMLNFLIRRLSRKGKIIIHSHNYLSSFFLLRPTDIFTVHDGLHYLYSRFGKPKPFLWIFSIIERVVYRRARVIQFVSRFSTSMALLSRRDEAKVKVIYNTTPLEELTNQVSTDLEAPPDTSPTVFSVRSIEERAYLELVFEAAEYFSRQKSKVRFVVAGKGPLLDHFRKMKEEKKLSNIELTGFVDDRELIRLYRSCDVVLVTAKYGEGFGLPVIEGYLFDKPVLGSDLCAIPEIIIDKSYLFDNKVSSLVRSIESVLSAPRKKNEFRNYYMDRFARKKILEMYSRLYASIA